MITGCFHFNNTLTHTFTLTLTHTHTHTLKQSVKILQISSSQTVVSSEHIFLLPLRDHDETTTQTQTAIPITPSGDHSAIIINTNTQWCWNDSSLSAHCSRVSHTVVLSALPRACVCLWSRDQGLQQRWRIRGNGAVRPLGAPLINSVYHLFPCSD